MINIPPRSTILITGATGLVGSALCRALSEANHAYGLNLHIIAAGRNQKKLSTVPAEQTIAGDIRGTELFAQLERVDYIFHCASVTQSSLMLSAPVDTILTAVEGTSSVLELARKVGCKSLVYLSSMEVYTGLLGEVNEETPLASIDLNNPRSSYPESKRFCELLCHSYFSQYNTPVRIARLAQTFGAGTSKDDPRVFAQFGRSALVGENIVLHTSGESMGNYCEISDTVDGLLTILLKGTSNEIYNISSCSATIKEMASMVADLFGVDVIVDLSKNTGAYAPPSSFVLNSGKLRSLGWNPNKGLSEIYREMLGDWRDSK